MLHNRQALGRDFHKHFSLAQPVVIPTPQTTRNPLPLPVPYKTGLKLAMRRREQPTCHSSLSLPPPHPACALSPPLDSLPSPLPPCPPSTSIKGRLERHPRGREGPRQMSSWDVRDIPHLNHNATHPDPSGPAQPYVLSDCRTPEPVSVPGALPRMAKGRQRWSLRASCATCLRCPRFLLAPVATTVVVAA